MGVARSKYVGWTAMASAEREPITGVWRRSDPFPYLPLCKNSSDLYQFQQRPLAKVGWTCPPQSTPWRRHCSACKLNATADSVVTEDLFISPQWN